MPALEVRRPEHGLAMGGRHPDRVRLAGDECEVRAAEGDTEETEQLDGAVDERVVSPATVRRAVEGDEGDESVGLGIEDADDAAAGIAVPK